ncbi:methyltransferase domain protein [Rhizoctonia solani]|uniref:Methyltransferase domain protein n=1 Tax=Rhizoctonia solani TaxID=456999 RepID=A0A8H8T0U0_9AGAM|nr:methyltransferase domain protein [Rhizoctonia solani]QRW24042.1 methyltransferase domain protein [Rhizoctonia solani]
MATPYYDEETEGNVYHTISSSSTARTTSTITSDQLSDFFRESRGRLYPLDENLPMTYPVDDVEVLRHKMQHQCLKALVHGRIKTTDIGHKNMRWQLGSEMAEEFPHCDVVSVDIAPIVTHTPRANLTFEVYDLYAGVAEPDESFDYISCRHVQTHVKEYDRLVFDLYRVLRPGLVSICEVENYLYETDQPPYNNLAYRAHPELCKGLDLVRVAMEKQGVDLSAIYQIPDWLRPNSEFWTQMGVKYQ